MKEEIGTPTPEAGSGGASRRVVGIKASTQRVVDYFVTFHKEHGKRPTMMMAAEALGFRSSSVVHHHLSRAERLGIKIPGESSFAVDVDIRALSACVKALETCTPDGLRANLQYLGDRFGLRDQFGRPFRGCAVCADLQDRGITTHPHYAEHQARSAPESRFATEGPDPIPDPVAVQGAPTEAGGGHG